MSDDLRRQSVVGRITGVFGIKGWLKVASYTEPHENIFEYRPWLIKQRQGLVELDVDQVQRHKSGWIVHLKGVDDRNAAELYKQHDIVVDQDCFADLDDGDYYWHELVGLRVISQPDGDAGHYDLGTVTQMMETGANDVLVVSPDAESIDDEERLLPYVPERFVKSVDLQAGRLLVAWDIDDE